MSNLILRSRIWQVFSEQVTSYRATAVDDTTIAARGIDVGAKKVVLDTLKRYNREFGMTIVMISSELEELRSVCDRIAIVDKGRIVGIKPASEPSETFGYLLLGTSEEEETVTA